MKAPRELLLDILGESDSDDTDDSPDHDRPCNVTGHNWEPAYSPDYYARSKTRVNNVLRIKKKTHEKCTKCDDYQNENQWIGEVKIDPKTDELSVVQ